jgi:hypothetical protein
MHLDHFSHILPHTSLHTYACNPAQIYTYTPIHTHICTYSNLQTHLYMCQPTHESIDTPLSAQV